jgi:hypothetical protein
MRNRMIFRCFIFVVLLAFPVLSFAQYKVVVKKNGKIIEGKLIAEDESSVTIVSQGARLKYKKDTLDLEQMKRLNEDYRESADVKTLDRPRPSKETKQETSLADVAKQRRETSASTASTPTTTSDSNERAFTSWIADLEDKAKMQATQASQIQLAKAKKGLSFYKNRTSRQLSDSERKLMLQQLIEALDFVYRKELEAGSSDDKLAAMKKKIEDTRQELESLE